MTKTNKISKEIFRTVYHWGRVGVVVDYKSFAYQTMIGQLLGNKSNGFHKIKTGVSGECFIEECKRKHLPF